MLQMKLEPNWASGFNLSLKGMLFESVDRKQTRVDNCLSNKLWWAKTHKICTSLYNENFYKSQSNRAYDLWGNFIFFSILGSMTINKNKQLAKIVYGWLKIT